MSASGEYDPVRIAAGIVGTANLTLRDDVAAVLDAHLTAGYSASEKARLYRDTAARVYRPAPAGTLAAA